MIIALFTYWLYVTETFVFINTAAFPLLPLNGQEIPSNILMDEDASKTQHISTPQYIPSIDVIENLHDIQTRAYGPSLNDDKCDSTPPQNVQSAELFSTCDYMMSFIAMQKSVCFLNKINPFRPVCGVRYRPLSLLFSFPIQPQSRDLH